MQKTPHLDMHSTPIFGPKESTNDNTASCSIVDFGRNCDSSSTDSTDGTQQVLEYQVQDERPT